MCAGVLWYAGLCAGVWVRSGVCRYARVCRLCVMNFQNTFWRLEYKLQRTLIHILYEFLYKRLLMPDLNGPRNDKLNRMKSWLLCIRWMIQNIRAKFFKLWTSFRSRCELLLGPKSYVMCHMYVLPHQCLEWPNLHK